MTNPDHHDRDPQVGGRHLDLVEAAGHLDEGVVHEVLGGEVRAGDEVRQARHRRHLLLVEPGERAVGARRSPGGGAPGATKPSARCQRLGISHTSMMR